MRASLPTPTPLERDEVHLWWGRIGADRACAGDLEQGLATLERARARRFRRARDAHAFLARRAFLRRVLAGYLGLAPGELVFEQGEFGKPALALPTAGPSFSLSRSGEWMLVGVASARALGVDVERLAALPAAGRELESLARRILSARERAELARIPRAQRARAVLRAWTRKEAVLKATGTGLSREPSTVQVGLEPLAGERVLAQELDLPGGARLLELNAPAGCAASLVVAAEPDERLRCAVMGRA